MCLIITDHQLVCMYIPKLANNVVLPKEIRSRKVTQAVTNKNISCVLSNNI